MASNAKVINEPTREGFEMGYHMARFADSEETKQPLSSGQERCSTCAFRQGTYPNGSPTTQMDVLKCVMQGVPFVCHEDTTKTCAGYALMRRGMTTKTEMPWPFSDEAV